MSEFPDGYEDLPEAGRTIAACAYLFCMGALALGLVVFMLRDLYVWARLLLP